MINLKVNGDMVAVDAAPQTPLLWVLREHLGLVGTRFGCGAGMCGACTVHLDGIATFSCQIQIGNAADQEITTIEGVSPDGNHPVQRAWIAEQVPQCGYCQSGQIMRAVALLKENPKPSRAQIVQEMAANLCRCGTYNRIISAIERAAQEN